MQKDVLIIGQGIAGTLLSAELLRQGKSVMVIDKPTAQQTSLVAAAVINPLIGKHWAPARDAAVSIPIALDTYRRLEQTLQAAFLYEQSLLVSFRTEEERNTYLRQVNAHNPYTSLISADEILPAGIHAPVGKIAPVYTIDAALLLQKWRQHLESKLSFRQEYVDTDALILQEHTVIYKDIRAGQLVWCEGAAGRTNPFFPDRAFTTNRGDALLLSIPGLSRDFLYQKGLRLVPRGKDLFWCGSNYTWEYTNLLPDLSWQQETLTRLKDWLHLPLELVQHQVAERPTTAGQVPILDQHQQYGNIFFFNGLGTRGFSAGPMLAQKMAEKMSK